MSGGIDAREGVLWLKGPMFESPDLYNENFGGEGEAPTSAIEQGSYQLLPRLLSGHHRKGIGIKNKAKSSLE